MEMSYGRLHKSSEENNTKGSAIECIFTRIGTNLTIMRFRIEYDLTEW